VRRPAAQLAVLALALTAVALPVVHRTVGAHPPTRPALPDLDPAAPAGLALQRPPASRVVLFGWATTIANRGPSALRLHAGPISASGERAALQTGADRHKPLAPPAGTLRYVSGYGHRHWHLLGLARYTLRNLSTGRVLTDRKQGFCLSAAAFATRACARDRPRASRVVLGLAPANPTPTSRSWRASTSRSHRAAPPRAHICDPDRRPAAPPAPTHAHQRQRLDPGCV
jgi:hypothetical protein